MFIFYKPVPSERKMLPFFRNLFRPNKTCQAREREIIKERKIGVTKERKLVGLQVAINSGNTENLNYKDPLILTSSLGSLNNLELVGVKQDRSLEDERGGKN